VDRLSLSAPEKVPPRDPDDWGRRPTWLFKDVRVDGVSGRYFYRFEPDIGPAASEEWEVMPWSPAGEPPFGQALPQSVQTLKVKAQEVWRDISDNFEHALRAGSIVAAARSGSPLADLTLVPKEAWAHFRVTDWDLGYAEDEHGSGLYALQIAEPRHSEQHPEVQQPNKVRRRDQITDIITRTFPNGEHERLTDKELLDVVTKQLLKENPNAKPPSTRTMRRAAGRDR